MSLDGFIATNDDDLSWLSIVDREGEDYGYSAFTKTVENYIVGRKTYEKVQKMIGSFPPAQQFTCYVISRTRAGEEDGLIFYNGDITALVENLKKTSAKNIYCDGGGEIVKLLMASDLIDEYIVSVIPVILGDGKRLFNGGVKGLDIELTGSRQYPSGLVQLAYRRKR